MLSISKYLIKIEQTCDIIPYVSTATNLPILLFKTAVAAKCISPSLLNHDFAQHLCNKNKLRCVTLLVPGYGNCAFVIYKLFMGAINMLDLDGHEQQNKEAAKHGKTIAGFKSVNETFENYLQELNQIQVDSINTDEANKRGGMIARKLLEIREKLVVNLNFSNFITKNVQIGDSWQGQSWKEYTIDFLTLVIFKSLGTEHSKIPTRKVKLEGGEERLNDYLNQPEILPLKNEFIETRKNCIEKTNELLDKLSGAGMKESLSEDITKSLDEISKSHPLS